MTPLRKDAWQLLFDGDSITLTPSVGSQTSRVAPITTSSMEKLSGSLKVHTFSSNYEHKRTAEVEKEASNEESPSILGRILGWLTFRQP